MLQKAHQLRPKEDKEISEAGGADWEYEIRTGRGLLYMHTGQKLNLGKRKQKHGTDSLWSPSSTGVKAAAAVRTSAMLTS